MFYFNDYTNYNTALLKIYTLLLNSDQYTNFYILNYIFLCIKYLIIILYFSIICDKLFYISRFIRVILDGALIFHSINLGTYLTRIKYILLIFSITIMYR